MAAAKFRKALLGWYDRSKRDLPWRRTSDPWAIHVSEVMLQQTRVAAVLPYYERFMARYPTAAAFAVASESEVLAGWAGLGYYSRARNLHRTAERISQSGEYPRDYEGIRALPGAGAYTAAAISSIAFGEARAAVDGNVLRVFARLKADRGDLGASGTRERLGGAAQEMLDPKRPGDFNQAAMELGATVCLPRNPQCGGCPVAQWCEAHAAGLQHQLPVKSAKPKSSDIVRRLLVVQRGNAVLLHRVPEGSARLAGFWELPESEQMPGAIVRKQVDEFRHAIVNTNHYCQVMLASAGRRRINAEMRWVPLEEIERLPLTTMARKALAAAGVLGDGRNLAHSAHV